MAIDSPTLTLHEIADGVMVWLQPGGESGVSNAGVVVDDDGLTVIDTLMVPEQWQPFATAVNALGRPVRRVILTHAHIDHVGGTSAFRNAMVLASSVTSDLLDQEMPISAYKAFMPAFTRGFDELEAIGTRPVSHVIDEPAMVTPRIEVIPAAGHTAGDVMVLIEDSDVLFAGDICFFGVTPLAFQGDVATWVEVLEIAIEMAETIVPGHGPIGAADDVRALQNYLRACIAADGDPSAIGAGPWDTWLERGERDAINVERAKMLASGESPGSIPPSMLKALGL